MNRRTVTEKIKKFVRRHQKLVYTAVILYGIFALTRFSHFTYYIPFTGRIFNVQRWNTDSITIRKYGNDVVFYKGSEGFAHASQILNDVRYRSWFVCTPFAAGGSEFQIVLQTGDPEASAIFGSVKRYVFYASGIEVNGLRYALRGDQLEELIEMVS